ncbi:MAG: AMP-binding protein, partial [Merismopedia sp. SIO2A8]|nr:AMP-binding protein [Merismopedia sp. SIO2A8]
MIHLLETQAQANWLVEQDNAAFLALTHRLVQDFTTDGTMSKKPSQAQSILIVESEPLHFLAGFLAAHTTHQRIFLGNPQWGQTEWQQAMAIAQPDHVWGNHAHLASSCLPQPSDAPCLITPTSGEYAAPPQAPPPLIMVPTGGSSGKIRFVMHTWQTLAAAVAGFQQYFNVDAVNSLCVLPLYHVSGLMQVMRSLFSGGKLWLAPFQSLKLGQFPPIDPSEWFISLVPTQLQRLLNQPHGQPDSQLDDQPNIASWLARCQTVFIGGAPTWPDLLNQARTQNIPVSLCYGMTETAAQIVALRPNDFLSSRDKEGAPTVGQLLPHAHITIVNDQNKAMPPGSIGQIKITTKSLALGYYPTCWSTEKAGSEFFTDDGGYFDDQGYLTLVGRLSDKIITGGENVFPAEVEAAIWATNLVIDIAVVGVSDTYWGQCVTAIYVPKDPTLLPQITERQLADQLHGIIAQYKCPKTWISVKALP